MHDGKEGKAMKKANVKTTTYQYKDFLIDITEDEEIREAWIYHKDYSIKSQMWGEPIDQTSFDDFIALVEENIEDYIESYKEEVMTE